MVFGKTKADIFTPPLHASDVLHSIGANPMLCEFANGNGYQ